MTSITVNGQDITRRVLSYNLDNALTADSQIRTQPVNIVVDNNDGAYFRAGRAHIPAGIALSDIAVSITRESGGWTGTLSHIDTHKRGQATLSAESALTRIMATPASVKALRTTPAAAIIALLESAGLEAGAGVYLAAREQSGLVINAILSEADNIPLSQALSAIADLASMRLIVTKSGIDAAVPHSETPYWVLRSRDVITIQSYNRLKSFDGFSVSYIGKVPAKGGAARGDIYTAECGAHSWLQINDYTTAARIGELVLMRPRWALAVTTRRNALYAAPGSVLRASIAEIGLDEPVMVTGVRIHNAWQIITLEECKQ